MYCDADGLVLRMDARCTAAEGDDCARPGPPPARLKAGLDSALARPPPPLRRSWPRL